MTEIVMFMSLMQLDIDPRPLTGRTHSVPEVTEEISEGWMPRCRRKWT